MTRRQVKSLMWASAGLGFSLMAVATFNIAFYPMSGCSLILGMATLKRKRKKKK